MRSLILIITLVFSFGAFAQADTENLFLKRADLKFQRSILKTKDSTKVEPYHTLSLIKLSNEILLVDLEIAVGAESEEYKELKSSLDRELKEETLRSLKY